MSYCVLHITQVIIATQVQMFLHKLVYISFRRQSLLFGVVVKAFASGAEDPGFDSRFATGFGRVVESYQ